MKIKIKLTKEQIAELVKAEKEQLKNNYDKTVVDLKNSYDKSVLDLEKKYEYTEIEVAATTSKAEKVTRQKLDKDHIFVKLWNGGKSVAEIRKETGYSSGYVSIVKGKAIKAGLIQERIKS